MTLYLRAKVLRTYKAQEFPFPISLPTVKAGKISESDAKTEIFINADRLEVTTRSYEIQYKLKSKGLFSNFEMRQIVEKHTETHWALAILHEFMSDASSKVEETSREDQLFLEELSQLIDLTHVRRNSFDPTFIKPSQNSQSRFAWKIALEETKRYFSTLPPQVTKNYEDSLKSIELESDVKEYSKRQSGIADELKKRIQRFAMASLLASSTLTVYLTGFIETIQGYMDIPMSYVSRTLHQLDPMKEIRAVVESAPEDFPRRLDSFVVRHYLGPHSAKSVSDLPVEKQNELHGVIFTINSERAMQEIKATLKKGNYKVMDENFHALIESYKELLEIRKIAGEKEMSEFIRKSKNFIRETILSNKLMSAKHFSQIEPGLDALLQTNPIILARGIPGFKEPLVGELLEKIGIQRVEALKLQSEGLEFSELTLDQLRAYDPLTDQYTRRVLGEAGK